MDDTIDPQVKNLVSAIGQAETGDSSEQAYSKPGPSGEYGRYQFLPSTWKLWAQEILKNPNAPMSIENQNRVAYQKVKQWKQAGLNPAQIASKWNSNDPEAYNGTFTTGPMAGKPSIGKNSLGVHYDVPSYAMKVSNNYNQLKASQDNSTDFSDITSNNSTSQPDTGLSGFATGFAKSGLSTIKELGNIGGAIGQKTLGAFGLQVPNIYSEDYMQQNPNDITSKLFNKDTISPQGTAENIGNVGGTIAQMMFPAGEITKTADLAKGLITGEGLWSSIARTAVKAGTEAFANTGLGYVQSGGDLTKALTQGLTSGVLSSVGSLFSNVPESLYGKIFKESKVALEDNLFGTTGNSLAQEARNKGIGGNLSQMATQISDGFATTEKNLVNWATNSTTKVPVDKNLYTVLDNIYTKMSEVGRGEGADKILELVDKIKGGEMDMKTALDIRRLLDGVRTNASYNQIVTKMGESSANLKYWSDDLRKIINNSGGAKFMKDFEFYYEAKDALVNAAFRTKGGIDYFDTAMGAGSVLGGNPLVGLAAIAGKHLFGTSGSNTYAADILSGLGKMGRFLTSTISNQASNFLSPTIKSFIPQKQ